MADTLEQRAMELLLAEVAPNSGVTADMLRDTSNGVVLTAAALRAIVAALQQAQQPRAQAVAWRYARPPEEGCTEEVYGRWNTIFSDSDTAFYERAVKEQGCRIEYAYLGQPPSNHNG